MKLKVFAFDGSKLQIFRSNCTPLLEELSASKNNLTHIDTTQLPQLKYLNISQSKIDELDFSNSRQLENLDISSTNIEVIDM